MALSGRVGGIPKAELDRFDQYSSFPTINTMRISLTSALAVTTADVSSVAAPYLTPLSNAATGYGLITLWDGGRWKVFRTREITAQTTTAAGLATDTNYDLFAYSDLGTRDQVYLIHGPAWSSATARALSLEEKDGVFVWPGIPERLYIGTLRTYTSLGDTYFRDTASNRYVWNAFNRKARRMSAIDATNTWAYTIATWRQANATASNRVEYVVGLSEEPVRASVGVFAFQSGGADSAVGVGVDSTTVNSAQTYGWANSTQGAPQLAEYQGWPGIGYHALNWLEISAATGTTTWRGDNGVSYVQSGMVAEVMA